METSAAVRLADHIDHRLTSDAFYILTTAFLQQCKLDKRFPAIRENVFIVMNLSMLESLHFL